MTRAERMINRVIEWSLRNRFLVACATLFVIALGVRARLNTPVDAIPDLSENQVIVFADWTGRSPQEVEDQVTYPLSVNLQGLAGVKTVRANSMFGFSLITIIFEDRIDQLFRAAACARAAELSRRHFARRRRGASSGRTPPVSAGSINTISMSIRRVAPEGGYDLGELRSMQDWFVRYQLNAVQGVAEVASIGGFVRQYQIEVDSQKMRALGVSLNAVMNAVGRSNLNVGGKIIEENGMEFVVRGVGLIKNAARPGKDRPARARRHADLLARCREGPDRRRFPARRARCRWPRSRRRHRRHAHRRKRA